MTMRHKEPPPAQGALAAGADDRGRAAHAGMEQAHAQSRTIVNTGFDN